jgi:hypothetical protein
MTEGGEVERGEQEGRKKEVKYSAGHGERRRGQGGHCGIVVIEQWMLLAPGFFRLTFLKFCHLFGNPVTFLNYKRV